MFAYAILRRVPNKLGGVVLLVLSVVVLYFLPFIGPTPIVKGCQFNYVAQGLFWVFVMNFVLLTYFGTCTVEYPYDLIPILSTMLYFVFFGV